MKKKIALAIQKNKIILMIISILIIIGISFFLVLSNGDSNKKNSCIVSFETNGGSEISLVELECGKKLNQPEKPTKEGFDFKYWIYEGETVDFDNFIINQDLTINAYWEIKEGNEVINIHFDTVGGSLIDDIEILKGTILNKPLDPIKEGYKFKYWMLENNVFDFETKLDEDITLVAKWQKIGNSNVSNNNDNSNSEDWFTTSQNVGYFNQMSSSGYPILRYESGRSDRCSGGFRSDVPVKDVEVGYDSYVGWTWTLGGDWSSNNDECFITHKSSNNNVATVSSEGKIETKTTGTVYIYECLNDTKSKKELLCFKGKLNVKEKSEIEHKDIYLINCNANYFMEVGDTQIVNSQILPADYSPTKFTWSSSDPNVVSIIDNNLGKVKALKPGEVTIYLKAENGVEGACSINVIKKKVAIENITINKKELTLDKGSVEKLKATISPENATDKSIIWTTSDSSVASVSEDGLVTAIGKGTAIIKAISNDGTIFANCRVTVNYNEVEGISLNKNSLTLYKGESETLIATIKPANAVNKNINFYSSDSSIATVDSNGLVTAKNEGTVTITVTTEEGGFKEKCTIVVKRISATGITLNHNEISLIVGQNQALVATITPPNAEDKTIIFSSSNQSVATVNSSGLVTAIGKGTAIITATTRDGNYSVSTTVNVKTIEVTGISFGVELITIEKGKDLTIEPTISPSNATNKKIRWESSNENIATVSDSGYISTKNEGITVITAITEDGNYKASFTLLVTKKPNDPLSATAKISHYLHSDSNGITTGVSVTITPQGGSGSYTYNVKVYKEGILINEVNNTSSRNIYIPGYDDGNYYAEIEVIDSEGERYSFVTETKTISPGIF